MAKPFGDEEGAHSPRGPSGAHRWRPCPGSIPECRGLPDTAGEEARQGTVFHEYAALCVQFGIEGFGFVGSRHEGDDGVFREFTKEMATKMLPGLDFLEATASYPDAVLYVEQKVDLEEWVGPGEFGTADAFVIDVPRKRLTVFDWKWGAGVPVSPDWNDQAILYTLGVWSTYAREVFGDAGVDPSEIEVVIVIEQPRAPGGGGLWKTQLSAVLAEGRQIRKDAEATYDDDAPRVPGEKQCQFCAAARLNTCKARADWIMDALELDVDEDELEARIEAEDVIDLPERRSISAERRSYLLLNRKLIEKWLEQLHEEAMEDSKHGRAVPGMKRVPGRAGARAWDDENKAEQILVARMGDAAYRKKLLSPAMLEEEVGKKVYRDDFERHVKQSDAKPILVPESDPREAIKSSVDLLDDMLAEEEAEKAETLI